MRRALPCLCLCLLLACGRDAPAPAAPAAPAQKTEPLRSSQQQQQTPARIVAIGDLHGDLDATRRALRLASAIGPDDHWSGGTLTVVQTGDTVDRGDQDREVLDLIERLRAEAARAGGAFVAMSGNHEIMNVAGDLRYVSRTSAAAFEQGRAKAFSPGAAYAARLAGWPVVAQVGDTVFVHGGVLPHHVRYGIERLNRETAAWMRGAAPVPALLMQEDAPIWTRVYSTPGAPADCIQLAQALNAMGAKRMVVGHTPQPQGISHACEERVYRIDTGMSKFYGGPVQVLEIVGGRVRVLTEASR